MFYLVKTECSPSQVDELTRKVANHEVETPSGNLSFVSSDGRIGYDIIEGSSESEIRSKYQGLSNYLRIVELTPIMPMGQFIEHWKTQKGLRM